MKYISHISETNEYGIIVVDQKKLNNRTYLTCKCSLCGKLFDIRQDTFHKRKHCGCAGKKKMSEERKWQQMKPKIQLDYSLPTTTGVYGVSYDSSRDKYIVYIRYRNKRLFLGRYDSLSTAENVRNNAVKIRLYCFENNLSYEYFRELVRENNLFFDKK